jgi:Spy/CpxP family protein refolding chaperone
MSLMGKALLGLGLAAFLLGGQSAYAQTPDDQGTPPGASQQCRVKGGNEGKRAFLGSLNLTDQQKEQLKGLKDLSREEREARLKEILTPEQYARVQEHKSQAKSRRGEGLNLTAQQKEELKGLKDLSRQERDARLKEILSPEQYARMQERHGKMAERRQKMAAELGLSESQKEQMKQAMMEVREQSEGMSHQERRALMREKMQTILTPEQLEKLEQMKPGRRGRN